METKWICNIRTSIVLGLTVWIAAPDVWAQSSSAPTQSATVDVEVPIPAGDVAAALEQAQKEALRKAVEQNLWMISSEEERKSRLQNPASFVKGFKILEQFEEAGVLKLKMKADVILSESVSSPAAAGGPRTQIEWVWRPNTSPISIAEIRKTLEEELQVRIVLHRLQYGSLVTEIDSTTDVDRLLSTLNERYGRRAMIRRLDTTSSAPGDFFPQAP